MKLITWNIAGREKAWHYLLNIDADLALLQEATEPPSEVAKALDVDPAPWHTAGAGKNRPWRAALANLSKQFAVLWFEPKSIDAACPGDLAVSRMGSLAAASVALPSGEALVVVSIRHLGKPPQLNRQQLDLL